MEFNKLLETYMSKTGQSRQYIYSGEQAFGAVFMNQELLPKAVKENKKIIWKDDFTAIDKMSYSLEDI